MRQPKAGAIAWMEQDAARKQLVAALARIAGGDRSALRLLYAIRLLIRIFCAGLTKRLADKAAACCGSL